MRFYYYSITPGSGDQTPLQQRCSYGRCGLKITDPRLRIDSNQWDVQDFLKHIDSLESYYR